MRNLFLKTITALFLLTSIAFASDKAHNHDDVLDAAPAPKIEGAKCEDTVNVKVNGLVCDFCARALEKVFSKRDEVSGINVDLNAANVTIAMKPGQSISDDILTQLITDSGYNVTAIDKGC